MINYETALIHIHILYQSSSKDFDKGYEKVCQKKIINCISWIKESDFKQDVDQLVGATDDNSFIMFLVDDNIFLSPIEPKYLMQQMSKEHLFISLRASRRYFNTAELPFFYTSADYLGWQWEIKRQKSNVWNYPFSVDGNIYHSLRMKQIVSDISFRAPNSFEGALHDHRTVRWIRKIRRAIAPLEAAVVNNPLNKVQLEGATWHKNIDPAYINSQYLQGNQIDNKRLYRTKPTSCHTDMGLHLVEEQS